ncbi:oxygen-independent coproporphyrinogen-3 oxidase [Amphibacillus marinus]|uniref:Heme chaperone HemW n=1 Tax=Amphibacillus marinus TaxID=872970 RepID=A0A1H8NS37_9BACI|nr:radical SAM family heme chaperone HemW [Amphibacillus marinus]SEO32379.1 oxygen-independent coproporphyrinogen-3 oxidase [Amphibacillus marinus]
MIHSVYIHIPFCEKICHYCDFTKFFYEEKMADQYLTALFKEMHAYLGTDKQNVTTIFVGGGTPTALNARQLERLLIQIAAHFDVPTVLEYTFEANPGDLDVEKIKLLSNYGVNRISMGVQAFDNQLLESLGRLHRVHDVEQNIVALQNNGLKNISIDLMYGLPNQTVESFADTIEQALAFDLPHYSSYALQIEPKTIFYQRHQKGKLHKPAEEVEVNMFRLLLAEMKAKGKFQYEVSNFAVPGYESQHNLAYWNNQYYYGFGAGAHGYLPGERITNLRPFPAYVKAAEATGRPVLHTEKIGLKEQVEEELFLGLRKRTGVNRQDFQSKYNFSIDQVYGEVIEALKEKRWLEDTSEGIRMTEQGQLFGNDVFQQFLLDEFDETILLANS